MFSFPPCCWAQDTSLFSNIQDLVSLESGEGMDITKGMGWGKAESPRVLLGSLCPSGTPCKGFSEKSSIKTLLQVQVTTRQRNSPKRVAETLPALVLAGSRGPWSKCAPRTASFSPFLYLHDATGIILLVKKCSQVPWSCSCWKRASPAQVMLLRGALGLEYVMWLFKKHTEIQASPQKITFLLCLQLNLLVTGRRSVMDTHFKVHREFYHVKNNKKIDPQNCLPQKIYK